VKHNLESVAEREEEGSGLEKKIEQKMQNPTLLQDIDF
jgi:hypothetical protein